MQESSVGSQQKAVGRTLDTRLQGARLDARCLLLTAYCLLVTPGCVYRSLTIRTEPPGAMVYVNDSLKGPSPVTYDFTWYGWHRVMVRKEDYERVEDRKLIRCPIYLWIPLDLAMELVPLRIKDARTWSYTLKPVTIPPVPQPPPITERSSAPAPSPEPSAPPLPESTDATTR